MSTDTKIHEARWFGGPRCGTPVKFRGTWVRFKEADPCGIAGAPTDTEIEWTAPLANFTNADGEKSVVVYWPARQRVEPDATAGGERP